MKKDDSQLISSTLKTVASENLLSANELNSEDKPLEEILNASKEKTTEETTKQ